MFIKKNKFSKFFKACILIIFLSAVPSNLFSQQNYTPVSDILLSLNKLNVLGSVLYIAAHPDDENTALLAYLSKGKLMRTGYLSLNRGDGGQNLIGNEKGDLLGVVRTQELLAARKIDGAKQFFTRAIDFGYSKSSDEAIKFWDSNLVLSDIVKIIRQFKPDIIITRFSKTIGGHGHHTASAILAEQAFYAAADSNMFTEQLKELKPWRAKRLLWNTWMKNDKSIPIEIGAYNPIIGQSFTEMAADSRSMHKSQGFGVSPRRGSRLDYFNHLAGDSAKLDIFENIDLTWNSIPDGNKIQSMIDKLIKNFEVNNPAKSVASLTELYSQLLLAKDNFWISEKIEEVKNLIKMCSGLWLEAIATEHSFSKGKALEVQSVMVNRSNIPVTFINATTTFALSDTIYNKSLEENKLFSIKQKIQIPEEVKYSQPYWLEEPHNGKMFSVKDPSLIGLAENKPELVTKFNLTVNNVQLQYDIHVVYKWNDAVKGELKRPLAIRPQLSVRIENPTYVFSDNKSREIKVYLEAKEKKLNGSLSLELPAGWICKPQAIQFDIEDKAAYTFNVTPSQSAVNGEVNVNTKIGKRVFTNQIMEIDYSHFPIQTVLKPAKASIIKLDIKTEPRKIAYIMGTGDEIPESLMQLGYKIDFLVNGDIDNKDLSNYDVIICGVRAFNAREQLDKQQSKLINFVSNGGTWIVQHNTDFGNRVKQIGPYAFEANGDDRIAEEDAPIKILHPEHSVFNYPNKITQKDFEGWIQERGLYFANKWDENLIPLLSGNDKGETSKLGGLLYSKYGKGVFIYTGYSWFRQLPAGVPGAYRLFVNIISAKGDK